MILALKLLIGGLAGGALIATPVLATQYLGPSSSSTTTQDGTAGTASSRNLQFQYKDKSGKKIECHGNRSYGIKLNGETIFWTAIKDNAETTNRLQQQNKGVIFEGDKSSCEVEE